ncbi:MAG: hypothetical protein IPJ19_01805 [Planctomycetes bacterium]|nr:hypothetical protein [Planctomycetota bacterium]
MNALASRSSLLPLVFVFAACQQTPARVEPTPAAEKTAVEAQAPRVARDGLDGCSADPSGPSIGDPGQCVTLVANDPFGWCWSFRRAASGVGLENGKPVNVAAEIAFDAYQPDSFTIGISGGEKGAIVDLGTADELASRFHYSERKGGARGFASIRVANGGLMICASDPNRPLQPLAGPDAELRKLQSSASAPVHEGHLYLVHLENPDWAGPITVKLVVLDHQANKSVSFRWLPVEDTAGTARFASARRSPWDADPSGSVTTLFANDPLLWALDLRTGGAGQMMQDGEVRNRDSHLCMGYYPDCLTVGIQGGETGAIVDLGTLQEAGKQLGLPYVGNSGNAYAGLGLPWVKAHKGLEQTAGVAHAPIQVGHLYIVRIANADKPDLFAKLVVLDFQPGAKVTFRWQLLEG